jgi:hypothetical protein
MDKRCIFLVKIYTHQGIEKFKQLYHWTAHIQPSEASHKYNCSSTFTVGLGKTPIQRSSWNNRKHQLGLTMQRIWKEVTKKEWDLLLNNGKRKRVHCGSQQRGGEGERRSSITTTLINWTTQRHLKGFMLSFVLHNCECNEHFLLIRTSPVLSTKNILDLGIISMK